MTRSLPFLALKTALAAAETAGLRPRQLDEAALMERAAKQTGLEDFGDPYFKERPHPADRFPPMTRQT